MPAPGLHWVDADGADAGLGDLLGNPVILSFLGSDWDPARAEYRTRCDDVLRTITSEAVAGAAGDVVQIAFDDRGCLVGFADRSEVRTTILSERELGEDAAVRYGVQGRRAVFVIDAEGTIRWRYVAPQGAYPRPEAVRDALRESLGLAAPQPITCEMTGAARTDPDRRFRHRSAAEISSRPRLPPRSRLL